ncbi:hypothetical protein CsSME_00010112 [Camellia sinensis var. sinensis]
MLPTPTGGRPPVRCHWGIVFGQWGRATSLGARPPLGVPAISHKIYLDLVGKHSILITFLFFD